MFIFNLTTPFPGTEMFNWARDNGYLRTLNWDDYDLGQLVMNLPTVSPEVIMKYYKLAYRKSYLRPGYLIKRLAKIRSYDSLKLHFSLFKDMIKSNIFNK